MTAQNTQNPPKPEYTPRSPPNIVNRWLAKSSTNINVKMTKIFGIIDKPMLVVLIILANIYGITDMFYMSITIESYRKSVSHCQRYGHGSQNCGYPSRYVKCAGDHKINVCIKNREQELSCYNCGEKHTANFRGCPFYKEVLATVTPFKKPDIVNQTTN